MARQQHEKILHGDASRSYKLATVQAGLLQLLLYTREVILPDTINPESYGTGPISTLASLYIEYLDLQTKLSKISKLSGQSRTVEFAEDRLEKVLGSEYETFIDNIGVVQKTVNVLTQKINVDSGNPRHEIGDFEKKYRELIGDLRSKDLTRVGNPDIKVRCHV